MRAYFSVCVKKKSHFGNIAVINKIKADGGTKFKNGRIAPGRSCKREQYFTFTLNKKIYK